MVVAWAKNAPGEHLWFVFEARPHRVAKSLSDLSGTDVYIHEGTIAGVFRELCNAFVRLSRRPTVGQMWRMYREVRRNLPEILHKAGATSVFEARVFRDVSVLASASADVHIR
jgi:hypothetical protein